MVSDRAIDVDDLIPGLDGFLDGEDEQVALSNPEWTVGARKGKNRVATVGVVRIAHILELAGHLGREDRSEVLLGVPFEEKHAHLTKSAAPGRIGLRRAHVGGIQENDRRKPPEASRSEPGRKFRNPDGLEGAAELAPIRVDAWAVGNVSRNDLPIVSQASHVHDWSVRNGKSHRRPHGSWPEVLAALEGLSEKDGLRVVVCWMAWRLARRWRRGWWVIVIAGAMLWAVSRVVVSGVALGH